MPFGFTMASNKKKIKLPASKKLGNSKIFNAFRGILVYVLVAFIALIFFTNLSGGGNSNNSVPISQVVTDVKDNKVQKLTVEGDKVTVQYKDNNKTVTAQKESGESIYQILNNSGVNPGSVTIDVADISWQQGWLSLLGTILPIALMIGFFFLIFRQAREAGNSVFSFGQSRARVFSKDQPQIKFADVAGVDEAKKELEEVVDFLKQPQKYQEIGAKIPKGVLLVGPPGTGKTLLSRAVAGEAGVPFFSIAGSEFMEMLVGVGAARVRDMFAQAKKNCPAIIFIDEIESIGRARGFGMSGGHDEREQTLNQILVEMDGFTPTDHVIVIGATNRPDLLDPALVRPGRFDRRVVLNMPDLEERRAIIQIHMKGKPFTKDVDLEKIARRTVGFSGADLANMLNESAILAARDGKKAIEPLDLEEAATKVKLGPQRKRMQTEADRKMTAYHEAGHALVGHLMSDIDPVHRISIVARGMTGGHTMFPPTEDRSSESKSRLLQEIATMLGGRAAEELSIGDISTGASNDLEVATSVARDMVTQYGMSNLGLATMKHQAVFGLWQPDMGEGSNVSEAMQAKVDTEINKILDTAHKQALSILRSNKVKLDKVAKALLEKETLESDEFEKIVGKKKSNTSQKV